MSKKNWQHHIYHILALLLIGIIGFLTGCAGAPQKDRQPIALARAESTAKSPLTAKNPPTPEELWIIHEKQLKNIDRWQMKGRIAATHAKEGGNASFVWKQTGDHYQIRFFGPFGVGSIYITGSPTQVSLVDGNGKHHQAPTPEELMQKVAGWQLPISGIRYWILGLPNPEATVSGKLLNQQGRLSQLTQLNWTVSYDRYNLNKFPGIPAKMQMHNHNYKIKIIIKDWTT